MLLMGMIVFGSTFIVSTYLSSVSENVPNDKNPATPQPECEDIYRRKESQYKEEIKKLSNKLKILGNKLKSGSSPKKAPEAPKNGPKTGPTYQRIVNENLEILGAEDSDEGALVVKANGLLKKDLQEVLAKSRQKIVNADPDYNKKSLLTFSGGIYRQEPGLGTRYQITFYNNSNPNKLVTVEMLRPFADVISVKTENKPRTSVINIILPLCNRINRFKKFLQNFANVCANSQNLHLTVVYFGRDGLQDVRKAITFLHQELKPENILLLTLNESFSRSRAIDVGVGYWNHGNALIFICDVDILFTSEFLDRCRVNASPGESVYYPVVFSQYNPEVVENITGKTYNYTIFKISSELGFWRKFGYGMCCFYKEDFHRVGGMGYVSSSWGDEDVHLYNKFTASSLQVTRSTDHGIFHIWHKKKCDKGALGNKYLSCIKSKIRNEMSHIQYGKLYFKYV